MVPTRTNMKGGFILPEKEVCVAPIVCDFALLVYIVPFRAMTTTSLS